ncbi:hypothetical protein NW807_09480, partial [Synechococcus sp. R70.1]|uniref:hypothetical protein n=1 Tax=Synechococcus sp. R70.1 TaxID=2964531 RepID=UPI0039C31554
LPTQEGHEAPTREVLHLATAGPVGPSSVSRAPEVAESLASDRLWRSERMELLVKQGSSYLATK